MSSKKYDDVSIYFDKNRNRYCAKVTVEKGKPRKNVYGKTEEEVLIKARQLLYTSRDEKFAVSKGMPLIELVKLSLERRDNAGRVGDASYNRSLYIIKQIEKSSIASKNVIELTEKDLQDFFNQEAKKYADTSLEKCYTEINLALEYAKRKKIIDYNPLDDTIRVKSTKPKKEVLPLTIEQQKTLSKYLYSLSIEDYKYKNALLIQLYMGLRIGEVLGLKKEDIDLKERKIHIQRTLTEDRNKKIVLGIMPKTASGNRVLPIPDVIYPYVKEQVEISKCHRENLLFLNNDKYVRHSCINDQFKRRLFNLGITTHGLSTHSLRHTYATRCIESGMPAIVLSKLLGHSDIRITLDTYVKVFNEFQTKMSAEVEKYYIDLDLIQKEALDVYGKINLENKEEKSSNIIQFPNRAINDYYDR